MTPGKGHQPNKEKRRYQTRIVVGFDPETFNDMRDRALKAGTSMGEQIRLLVEWGLEAEREL